MSLHDIFFGVCSTQADATLVNFQQKQLQKVFNFLSEETPSPVGVTQPYFHQQLKNGTLGSLPSARCYAVAPSLSCGMRLFMQRKP
jgi:hypothetical protein